MDEYKLPAVYGKSRLVLLPVDPYLIHAYWEVAPEDLDKAREQAGQAQEVLRFYKTGEMAKEEALADCFDVEIDLRARNWYVHLWSAEESYCADLALKSEDGTLIRVVRSQVVHMPRTQPAIAIDERFMKVDSTEGRAEVIPPPPAQHQHPQEAAALRVNELTVRGPVSRPIDSAEIVREKLKSVYASRQWHGHRFEPENAPAAKRCDPSTGSPDTDLTAMAERDLAAGLSSASLQQGRMDGPPDSRK